MHRNLETIADDEAVGFDELLVCPSEDEAGLRTFVDANIVRPLPSGKFLLRRSVEAYCAYWEGVIAEQDKEADADLAQIEPHGSA